MADTPLPYSNRIIRASKGSLKFRVKKADFGDGLKQLAADGLNATTETWDITWRLTEVEFASVLTTIRSAGVWTILSWTTPYENLSLRWTFSDSKDVTWQRVGTGNSKFEITCSIEQYHGE